MKRVLVVNPFMGICHMGVCCAADVTDEEVLQVCNRENRAGTTNGWSHVIRTDENPDKLPKPCADEPGRIHLLVAC